MRRSLLYLSLAVGLVLAYAVAPVMAARHASTGERLSLTLDCWDDCGAPQSFAANTPFHIQHGHAISVLAGENPAVGRYDFVLEVDGEQVAADFHRIESYGHSVHGILWTFNFPDGMTGEHDLTGRWIAPCGYTYDACDGTNDTLEYLEITVHVTFV